MCHRAVGPRSGCAARHSVVVDRNFGTRERDAVRVGGGALRKRCDGETPRGEGQHRNDLRPRRSGQSPMGKTKDALRRGGRVLVADDVQGPELQDALGRFIHGAGDERPVVEQRERVLAARAHAEHCRVHGVVRKPLHQPVVADGQRVRDRRARDERRASVRLVAVAEAHHAHGAVERGAARAVSREDDVGVSEARVRRNRVHEAVELAQRRRSRKPTFHAPAHDLCMRGRPALVVGRVDSAHDEAAFVRLREEGSDHGRLEECVFGDGARGEVDSSHGTFVLVPFYRPGHKRSLLVERDDARQPQVRRRDARHRRRLGGQVNTAQLPRAVCDEELVRAGDGAERLGL
mmetsp:Transcript_12223/g.43206  ORF Transcript_12223/g.43206 Transcript_12223/m.43206 type:complete len:348 (-) Transcript_12223:185-1228(-)